jgi:hypothetical protein
MKAKILFKSLQQDSQDYGTFERSEAHVVSVIHFDMQVDQQQFRDLKVEVRQPCGTDFESEPLEVGRVAGYEGPWDHAAFADLCEHYYRGLVGSAGRGIRISGGSNIRMRNNTFAMPEQVELEIPGEAGGAW